MPGAKATACLEYPGTSGLSLSASTTHGSGLNREAMLSTGDRPHTYFGSLQEAGQCRRKQRRRTLSLPATTQNPTAIQRGGASGPRAPSTMKAPLGSHPPASYLELRNNSFPLQNTDQSEELSGNCIGRQLMGNPSWLSLTRMGPQRFHRYLLTAMCPSLSTY